MSNYGERYCQRCERKYQARGPNQLYCNQPDCLGADLTKHPRFVAAPVKAAEHEAWALERLLEAVYRLGANLGDKVLAAAVVGRCREYRGARAAREAAEKRAGVKAPEKAPAQSPAQNGLNSTTHHT